MSETITALSAGKIEFLREYCGSSIYIKRDDLIPFSYGGNKVRIAEELLRDIREGGYNAVISYGSPTSNMNRAVADLCRREGLKCYVIIKPEEEAKSSGPAEDDTDPEIPQIPMNERLVLESGAEVICLHGTSGSEIKAGVDSVLQMSTARGERPYYIYGDSSGKGNEAVLMRASYKEYGEILTYERETLKEAFDAIVLTAGTGMTISGLAAAMEEAGAGMKTGTNTEVNMNAGRRTALVGISAARPAEKELQVIRENLEIFRSSRNAEKTAGHAGNVQSSQTDAPDADSFQSSQADAPGADADLPVILDEYLCGGYGLYSSEIEETIREMKREYDLALDPTYTGKSFYGMLKEIEKGHLGGNILFIHTGGYPIYLDWASERTGS